MTKRSEGIHAPRNAVPRPLRGEKIIAIFSKSCNRFRKKSKKSVAKFRDGVFSAEFQAIFLGRFFSGDFFQGIFSVNFLMRIFSGDFSQAIFSGEFSQTDFSQVIFGRIFLAIFLAEIFRALFRPVRKISRK